MYGFHLKSRGFGCRDGQIAKGLCAKIFRKLNVLLHFKFKILVAHVDP